MLSPDPRRLIRWVVIPAVIGTAVLAVSFVLVRPFTALPDYDSMVNAQLPKNLVLGRGFLSTYPPIQGYEKVDPESTERWFNVEATTGPGHLLLSALLMKVFGIRYWIPGFTTAALSVLFAACAVLFLAARKVNVPEGDNGILGPRATAATVVLLLSLALTAHLFWPDKDDGFLRHWFEGIGDVPAGLATGFGAAILFSAPPTRSRSLLGGLMLAWAHLIKTLALITNGAVILGFATWLFARRDPKGKAASHLGFLLGGAVAPVAAFALWRRIMLGRNYEEWSRAEDLLFAAAGSGIAQLKDAKSLTGLILGNISRHCRVLAASFAAWQLALLIVSLLALALYLARGLRARLNDGSAMLTLSLLLGVMLHAGWWTTLEYQGWTRRLVQALVLLALCGGAAVATIRTARGRMIALVLSVALAAPNLKRLVKLYPSSFSKDPDLVAGLEAAALLSREKAAGSALVGCGWAVSRALEFMIDGTKNFVDCNHPPAWTYGRRLVLVRDKYWQLFGRPWLDYFSARCEHPVLFDKPPFKIGVCSSSDLRTLIVR